VGVYANPRRPEKVGHQVGPVDDCPDLEGARDAAGTRAADLMADISPRALGRDRGRGFLHHGGLDVARLGDVLDTLRH
jgi:hypothetical protein